MSRFVKISYPSQSNEVNEALKECIMYIGNHYGNNRDNLYKSGVDYLAKKVKGASKTAVRRMVYSKKIKNHAEREWHFRKKIYAKTYECIFYTMITHADKIEERPKAIALLRKLYNQIEKNPKLLSDVTVPLQKDMLKININMRTDESETKAIKEILNAFRICDNKYLL